MKQSTDVVIVGGGAIGCSIAYHLRKRDIDVIVLDQGELGRQASSAATGLLAPLKPFAKPDDPYTILLLTSFGLLRSLVPELEEASGVCVEFEQTGTLRVVQMKQMSRLQTWLATWQEAGWQMELLAGDVLRQCEPVLASNITAAIYNPHEAQIKAPRLVDAYAHAAAHLGATLYPHIEVIGIQCHGTRIEGVSTSQGDTIACNHLVIAAGAWAARCGDWLGITLPVRPLRGQGLSLLQPVTPLRHMLFGEGIYLAPKSDGTITVGATRDDVGFDTTTTTEGISWLRDGARRLAPACDGDIQAVWAGLRPKTPDGRPILGGVASWENVTVATGHHGFGILLSAITGQAIAELVTTGQAPDIIRSFALERFLSDPAHMPTK